LLLVLTRIALAASVGDDGCCEVAEDPWAGSLNGIDECGGEGEFDEGVAGGVVVEEGEERPVDQPCSVLELGERVVV
jgi:hypothetical protein